MNIVNGILFFVLVVLFSGCISKKEKVNFEYQKIKNQYESIVSLQYDADKGDLLRTDRMSYSAEVIQDSYQHPVAWTGYLLYNFPLMVMKESTLLIASPFVAGINWNLKWKSNALQDNLDDAYHAREYVYYPDMYYRFWSHNKKGDQMNMDSYDIKKVNYSSTEN